jgi:hypothetical protein
VLAERHDDRGAEPENQKVAQFCLSLCATTQQISHHLQEDFAKAYQTGGLMTLSEAANLLVAYALENPPAQVAQRTEVFRACKLIAKADSELAIRAATLVLQLDEHEKMLRTVQQELPLILEKTK